MKRSSLIPLLVIAGVGGYLLYKHFKSSVSASASLPAGQTGITTTPFTLPWQTGASLTPINTASLSAPIPSSNLTPLTAPTNPNSFWAGVQNFLNPGSAG